MADTTATAEHYTAWLTTDRSCLDGDYCDVVVLADEETGYETDRNGFETDTPVWTSTNDERFHAVTTARHDADTDDEALKQAQELLEDAGWRIVGDWEGVPTGCTVTVERDDN